MKVEGVKLRPIQTMVQRFEQESESLVFENEIALSSFIVFS